MLGPEDCIFFQITRAQRSALKFFHKRIRKYKITPPQAMVINFLNKEDNIASVELGRKAMLDSATLTGIIDRLESSGIVERKPNPDDRRAILVCLSKKGKKLADKLYQETYQANIEFLQAFSREEEKNIRNFFLKI
ncbi:MAG: MarR family transcriptional regulator [Leptospiraceae bacterium]|nr:MarR family transcriptional regulator [Leptospiraceae bacterium]MCP5501982.1 MarR family transcriptional regulator [Leptospiraceae bacterium]